MVKDWKPIFARANAIAKARYPNGANATLLAEVLREAIAEEKHGLLR